MTGCAGLASAKRRVDDARHRHIGAGELIMREGDTPDHFSNVVAGVIKLTCTFPDGRESILGLQLASDCLGRPYRAVCGYDVHAVTAVHLCSFPRRLFESLLQEFPDLDRHLFKQSLDELDAAREWAGVLTRHAARERLSSLLLIIMRRIEAAGCANSALAANVMIDLPFSRLELANYLGLTVETVSRQFTQLKNDGIISLTSARELVVLDQRALEAAAGA